MAAITPALFLGAVQSLIEVGQAVRENYRERLREADVRVLLPPAPELSQPDIAAAALKTAFEMRADWCAPGQELAGLFRTDAQMAADIDAQAVERLIEAAIAKATAYWCRLFPPQAVAALGGAALAPEAVRTVKAWVDPDAPKRRRARLGLALADTVLTVAKTQPSALGLTGKAEMIVAALAANLDDLIDDDQLNNADQPLSFGERAVRLFLSASLETAVEQPSLIADKAGVGALVSGALAPLLAEVRADPQLEYPAQRRLQSLLRGPIAFAALEAVHQHSGDLMRGDLKDKRALGAVTKAVIGEVLSARQAGARDLRSVFSDQGVGLVYRAALKTAQARPELFIIGDDRELDAARDFLRQSADILVSAPAPFDLRSGLGAQIAAAGLDVAAAYAGRRLHEDNAMDGWSQAGAAVGAKLIGEVLEGFKAGITDAARANPFERLFDRAQALDILKIVATYAAETPGMVVGEKANPEVKNIAAGIARLIAADETGLMRAQDWRGVAATALDLAARNPAALFSIEADANPESFAAVALIKRLLGVAGGAMQARARQPGALLFGDTLRRAAESTLAAAANTGFAALDPARAAKHLDAFSGFTDRLLTAARGTDPTLRMDADDWLRCFRWYVAYTLDEGPDAKISDDDLRRVLRTLELPHAQGGAG